MAENPKPSKRSWLRGIFSSSSDGSRKALKRKNGESVVKPITKRSRRSKLEQLEMIRTKLHMHTDALSHAIDCTIPTRSLQDRYGAIEATSAATAHTTHTAKLLENRTRNRYHDILPYDHTLVPLSSGDPAHPAYINASRISPDAVPGSTRTYIATQGPTAATCGQFWQMIWEQECEIVVMLTLEKEGGKDKCFRYWPEPPASSSTHADHTPLSPGRPDSGAIQVGGLLVAHVATHPHEGFVERRVVLKMGRMCRRVTQLQFTEWPDKTTPDPSVFLAFLSFYRAAADHLQNRARPIVVHCSAGVGRTGAFIAMDVLAGVAAGGEMEKLDPQEVVTGLRTCRFKMVQTPAQFAFLYTCLRQHLAACMEDVQAQIAELSETKKDTKSPAVAKRRRASPGAADEGPAVHSTRAITIAALESKA